MIVDHADSHLRSTWFYRAQLVARPLATEIIFSKKVPEQGV